ncbi:MerR family transcriptional regulator [Nocardia sp. NPDC006044]|uniref:MerR family transcriptional regulator n=1 Tax=Nocardia sp. NPDC006044 TaxID=3364306 RepID=UPI00368B2B67
MAADVEYTIDELARAADTTVRSVRVYHERGLLPSPEVRGRVGYYGSGHLNRLETISRLLSRGMKLNGIKELLQAWDRGDGLGDVLGVTDQAAARPLDFPDENAIPELPDYARRALAANTDPRDAYRMTNPRCSDLATRLVDSGLPPDTTFQLVERLRFDCDRIAERCADELFDRLVGQAADGADHTGQNRASVEVDLAVARLIVTRAASELLDQAFGRHAERYTAPVEQLTSPR